MRNVSCTIFYMKMNIMQNFHTCISVPFNFKASVINYLLNLLFGAQGCFSMSQDNVAEQKVGDNSARYDFTLSKATHLLSRNVLLVQ